MPVSEMYDSKPILLLTRPQTASEQFWQSLPEEVRTRSRLILSPLLEIVPVGKPAPLQPGTAAIFTSANAVACFAAPVAAGAAAYCVGQATRAAAETAGWQAECLGETAEELLSALSGQRPGPMVHLRGRHIRTDLAGRLAAAGLTCGEQVVYDQRLLPLNKSALMALAGPEPVIVPLFSPRTARQFAETAGDLVNVTAITLSEAVADPLKTRDLAGLSCAARPDAKAMRKAVTEAIERLCRVEGTGGAH